MDSVALCIIITKLTLQCTLVCVYAQMKNDSQDSPRGSAAAGGSPLRMVKGLEGAGRKGTTCRKSRGQGGRKADQGGRKAGRGDIVRGAVAPRGRTWREEGDRWRGEGMRMGKVGMWRCSGEDGGSQKLEGEGRLRIQTQGLCGCGEIEKAKT